MNHCREHLFFPPGNVIGTILQGNLTKHDIQVYKMLFTCPEASFDDYFKSSTIILSIITCVLHCIGICVLFSVKKEGRNSSQWYCLLNLSVSEFIQNVTRIIHNSLYIEWQRTGAGEQTDDLHKAFARTWLVLNTGIAYQCIMAIILITGDRFLCVYLGLRYRSVWHYRKTVVLIGASWVVNMLVASLVSTHSHAIVNSKVIERTLMCVIMLLSLFFLLFALYTYAFIFITYVSSRRITATNDTSSSQISLWQAFRTSKFFISALLVSSFLVFWVVPVLIVVIRTFISGSVLPLWLNVYVSVSVVLSDLMDGIIYVILSPLVRKQMRDTVRNIEDFTLVQLKNDLKILLHREGV